MTDIQPVIKWAGGKRWLLNQHLDLFPTNYRRLVEPFVGGASVFLRLKPREALLSDVNPELITTYLALRDNWKAIKIGLRRHEKLHCEKHYYAVRAQNPTDPVRVAIRFLYLNRTCWNGLYRVNKKGLFNVPIGTKTKVVLESDDFEELSNLLSTKVRIVCQDFGSTLKSVRSTDFVYVDPPYTVNHNVNGFLKYNESIFSWEDQIRLRKCIEAAADSGAKIIVSQAKHESVIQLYSGIGKTRVLTRQSVLAGKSKFRGKVEEILISINC